MKTLVIIPAYNEAGSIAAVLCDLQKNHPEYDYLVINDGSIDDTEKVLEQYHAHYVTLPCNLGIGGGVQAGYLYAYKNRYDCAVQMDGDGQHDSAYLDAIVQPILNGEADFVIGSRYIQQRGFQSSALRRLGIQWLSAVIYMVCGTKIKDVTSGFRAVNRNMITLFANHYADDYPEPEAIVTAVRHDAKVIEVPVIMKERISGTSSISSVKSIYYMLKVTLAILFNSLLIKR